MACDNCHILRGEIEQLHADKFNLEMQRNAALQQLDQYKRTAGELAVKLERGEGK